MARLYTAQQMQTALGELRIKPVRGKVTTEEAAKILTWRAKDEQGVEHEYPVGAVRQHVTRGKLKAYPVSKRFNLYKVEDIFDLPLVPNRGIAQRKEVPEAA